MSQPKHDQPTNPSSPTYGLQPFTYTPLNPEHPHSFRLLWTFPPSCNTNGLIKCSLREETTGIDTQWRHFTWFALSYTWDSPSTTPTSSTTTCTSTTDAPTATAATTHFPIEVNGTLLHIGANLHAFLHRYQHSRLGRNPIWIDAVCINQQDVVERNQQVGQMRRLYGGAYRVIVWLGDGEDGAGTKGRFGVVERYLAGVGGDAREGEGEREEILEVVKSVVQSTRYWSRIWILQEFILPEYLLIWCGIETGLDDDAGVDGKKFARLLLEGKKAQGLGSAHMLVRARDYWHRDPGSEDFTLLNLVRAFLGSQCTVPHDRIYGLLGLATDVDESTYRMRVDYALTPVQVVVELLKHQCGLKEGMSILNDFAFIRNLMIKLGAKESDATEIGKVLPDFDPEMFISYWRLRDMMAVLEVHWERNSTVRTRDKFEMMLVSMFFFDVSLTQSMVVGTELEESFLEVKGSDFVDYVDQQIAFAKSTENCLLRRVDQWIMEKQLRTQKVKGEDWIVLLLECLEQTKSLESLASAGS